MLEAMGCLVLLLAAGCWLVAGCLLATGCWLLVGCLSLFSCWLLAAG